MQRVRSGRFVLRALLECTLGLGLLGTLLLLGACQPQFIAPYNASIESRATDMLADVSAWDQQMDATAGTAAADPRGAAVQTKLAGWSGSIEGIAAIEAGAETDSATCDKFVGTIAAGIAKSFATLDAGATTTTTGAKCDSLPDIVGRMATIVNTTLPEELAQQCEPLSAGTATAIASPTAADYKTNQPRCQALFDKDPTLSATTRHGEAINALTVDLDAIIYRESREAPKPAS